jgi:hypothetical protein
MLVFYIPLMNWNSVLGSSEELLAKEKLEEAYQIPFSMLKQKESLFRHGLEARNFSQENKDRLL